MFSSRTKTGFALLFIIILQALSLPYGIKSQYNETFSYQINDDVLIGFTTETICGMPACINDRRGFSFSLFRQEQGSCYIVSRNGFINNFLNTVILLPDNTCNTGI